MHVIQGTGPLRRFDLNQFAASRGEMFMLHCTPNPE
jgi:hypothetical protein